MKLVCGHRTLDLVQPVVMGVLNVTPDSFSDGGQFTTVEHAVEHALAMTAAGAAIIDVGGESTRPGAAAVTVEDECQRVIPVIEALTGLGIDAVISVDTSKAEVMQQAVAAGASMINDVCALQQPGALQVAVASGVPVCLMHMQGDPRKMQDSPQYENVTDDIVRILQQRVDACVLAGISRDRIVLDPGFGFGKTVQQNFVLLRQLERFKALELPLLVGLSRKSMIGAVLDADADHRLYGSLAAAVIAIMSGANIIRVHDVSATVDAIKICTAVKTA